MSGDNVDTTGFNQLAAEFAQLGRAFAGADAALREPASGSDADGAFAVVVDADGRVAEVHPNARWRQLVAADQVGDSIVEAVQAAGIARLDRWSSVLEEQAVLEEQGNAAASPGEDQDVPLAPASRVDLEALRADAPYVDIVQVLDEVMTKLESAVAASTALMSPPADPPEAADPAARRLSDDGDGETTYGTRPVIVWLDAAGAPERVEVLPRWLATVNLARLGETIRDAFDRAYQRSDVARASIAGPTARPAAWSSGMTPELRELIRNPAGVFASFAAQLP